MRTKHITMRQSNGFQHSLTVSVVDTPKGAVRTIEIIDHSCTMLNREPSERMVMTFNENWPDTNTTQLKEFCEFVLKEINSSKKKKK